MPERKVEIVSLTNNSGKEDKALFGNLISIPDFKTMPGTLIYLENSCLRHSLSDKINKMASTSRSRTIRRTILAFLVLGLLYLLFWPVSLDPQPWDPPEAPSISDGIYKANEALSSMDIFSTEAFGVAPEDIAVDTNGFIYGGLVNGKILKFQPDGSNPRVLLKPAAGPLGFILTEIKT